MKCRKTIYLTLVFLLSVFAVGCEENEPMEFEGGSRALFYEEGSSFVGIVVQIYEKNYSFALVAYDQMEIEAKINVRLMGPVVDRDRKFKAEVVKELSTAVEGTHFRLGEAVMKAGEYWSQLPVTLCRTADMKEKAVSITLRLVATEDLLGGVGDGGSEEGYFTLHVGDFLMEPQNWPTLYFGEYSVNKYSFVVSTLGIADFPAESRYDSGPSEGTKFTVSEMYTFKAQLQAAYAEYRAEHGPIYMDDNAVEKVEISF